VGEEGKVYAVDVHTMAVEKKNRIILKKRLTNVSAIQTNCKTGLSDESIDVVLLFDVLHGLENPGEVLKEIYRVLKPGGILSVRDHHTKISDILPVVAKDGLFSLSRESNKIYDFAKGNTHEQKS
jgi:ubiquinone/menaquinone biosynthesis C-methylase UbiE